MQKVVLRFSGFIIHFRFFGNASINGFVFLVGDIVYFIFNLKMNNVNVHFDQTYVSITTFVMFKSFDCIKLKYNRNKMEIPK